MNLILYEVLIVTLLVTSSYVLACQEEYDTVKCVYNFYCVNEYILSNDVYTYTGSSADNTLATSCADSIYVEGHSVQPINLIYKSTESNRDQLIPNNYHGVMKMIVSLNISYDEYHYMPKLKSMENLKWFNISNNYITEACLSNEYELPSLIEIDFSYNTIKDLVVKPEENIYKYLKVIHLSHNYLVKLQDGVFESFKDIELLDLSYNFINSITQSTFEGLKNLLYLNISHNRIADINSSLFRFTNIKILKLNNNKLIQIKTVDFENLVNLENLDLSSNTISVMEKKVFSNMIRLVSLDLSDNFLDFIDKDLVANLTILAQMNFSKNRFKHLPVSMFRGKSISSFFIQENYLEGTLAKGVFEGLNLVTELDLSFQHLSTIEDFAFIGLSNLEVLLLNNNNLNLLLKKCFRTLHNLHQLDLSNNNIDNIEFDKDDLHSLQSLSLRDNHLIEIKEQHFQGLSLLQFLDLSNNHITKLESNAFISLAELINFEISNNPLTGTLKENTFVGLTSLPNLDISSSLLITIQNNSLGGMNQLKTLNMSHSTVIEIGYNAFMHTGSIQVLDISYNVLNIFLLNTTELTKLETLFINNNLLTFISSDTFSRLSHLLKIDLASNSINLIESTAFQDQKDLRNLDLSFNSDLIFNVTVIKGMKTLNDLNLSGVKSRLTFERAADIPLSKLQVRYLQVTDIKVLKLNKLTKLDHLIVSNNNMTKLEVGAFNNLTMLRSLDVSCNQLSFIQPGLFKENTLLFSLNVSHNLLTVLSYGIFRGLIYLDILDISYNKINDLKSERFYEVSSLTVIIADNNMIKSVSSEAFVGTRLRTLSIGGNPLPCDTLVNLKKYGVPFEITAIKLDDKSDEENVDGVTCNMNDYSYRLHIDSSNSHTNTSTENDKTLDEIKDILLSYSNKYNGERDNYDSVNETKTLIEVVHNIEKNTVALNNKSLPLVNITSTIVQEFNSTNLLLEKILKVLSLTFRKSTIVPLTKNITNDNITVYINYIKREIEDHIAYEKQELLTDMEKKIDKINSRIDSLSTEAPPPKREKLTSSATLEQSQSLFTETCVALILAILVCFVLIKFYKSRMYIRNRLSISTRELPGAMENSTL